MQINSGDLDRLGAILRDYRRVRQDYATMVEATSGQGQECSGCGRLVPSPFLAEGKCAECWRVDYHQVRDSIVELHWHAALHLGLKCINEARQSWDQAEETVSDPLEILLETTENTAETA